MTATVAGGYAVPNSDNGGFHSRGPRRDGKKKVKKGPLKKANIRRPIPGQWMIDEWANRSGLDSEWLGLNAWNGELNSQEADALLKACNKVRKVSEDAFWQAYSGTQS